MTLPMVSTEAEHPTTVVGVLVSPADEGQDHVMMRANGYDTYQRVQAETSSPGQLIALLYDAMLRSLDRARHGLEERDLEAAHGPLLRAQDIVLELISSLNTDDKDDAGALASQLAPLYEYMYRRLLDASLQKDAAPVHEVSRLITPMRHAWQQALESLAREAAVGHAEVIRG